MGASGRCSDLRPPGLLVTGPRRSRKQTPPQHVNASRGLRKDPAAPKHYETWTGPPPFGGLVTLLVPLFPRRANDKRLIVTGRTLTDRQTETTRARARRAGSLDAAASRRLVVSTHCLNIIWSLMPLFERGTPGYAFATIFWKRNLQINLRVRFFFFLDQSDKRSSRRSSPSMQEDVFLLFFLLSSSLLALLM